MIGPAILGLVEVDLPLQVLALLGLAFLLFLAGLEIDLDRLRGARLRSAATGFVISLAVALGIGLGLYATWPHRGPAACCDHIVKHIARHRDPCAR